MIFLGFWRQMAFKPTKPDISIFTVFKGKKDILNTKAPC